MYYLGHPNSFGMESSNSQQHGKWSNKKANIYLFPLFKSWDFVKKKNPEKNFCFLFVNYYLKILSILTLNNLIVLFNQSTLPYLLVLPKDTILGVTLGILFGGFILGVIVTAVVTTLMYIRLKLRNRKKYICLQFFFYLSNILHTCILIIWPE